MTRQNDQEVDKKIKSHLEDLARMKSMGVKLVFGAPVAAYETLARRVSLDIDKFEALARNDWEAYTDKDLRPIRRTPWSKL